VLTLIAVALVFGVVNAVVRPIANLLSLPLIILTLGLMIFVVNALMLLLTSWIAGQLGLGFHVDGFWTAVGGALIITVATWVLELVLRENR
jgi:putative membrane protein